jgi:dienelactone hydrolase
VKRKRRHYWLLPALPILGLGAFVGWKSWRIASELLDPPFYHAQPIARIEATYRELAAGVDGDPGGTWSKEPVGNLELWQFRRPFPAPGVVLLLHGFGDDRWGTSPALKYFPQLNAAIFTYRRRDDAQREKGTVPPVTFGAEESQEVVRVVHHLEASGIPRQRILLMGRSLGASIGMLALADLEREGRGGLAGFIWEGAPASSQSFAERLVRGPEDLWWHGLSPAIGAIAARSAGWRGHYDPADTNLLLRAQGLRFSTPSLCFLATQDRLAPPEVQRALATQFASSRVVEVATWHLHCADVLGPAYPQAIHRAVEDWLPSPAQKP